MGRILKSHNQNLSCRVRNQFTSLTQVRFKTMDMSHQKTLICNRTTLLIHFLLTISHRLTNSLSTFSYLSVKTPRQKTWRNKEKRPTTLALTTDSFQTIHSQSYFLLMQWEPTQQAPTLKKELRKSIEKHLRSSTRAKRRDWAECQFTNLGNRATWILLDSTNKGCLNK